MPATHPAPATEWSILLTACSSIPPQQRDTRLRSLLEGSISWKSLFALADRHGVDPLLHRALVSVEDAVPPPEMRTLTQIYQDNVYKSLLLSRELIRILDHLSAANLDVLVYKGLALAEALYGDIAMRRTGDIDLLIRSKDLPRIRQTVRDLGYSPHQTFSETEERAYLKSGYECAFDSTIGANLLEVQWAIQPRFYVVDFDIDGLFERAVTMSVAGRSARTPSPSDLMLVLSAHAAKHVWGRLIWLCDIAQLLKLPDLDWDWIGSQAKSLGVARIIGITMALANRLLDVPTPAAAKAFALDSPTSSLVKEIQASVGGNAVYNVESLAYFRLMLRLRERPSDRLRFLMRLALTPGPGEWQAVRLPKPLFPLYRLVRLTRLAAKAVGA
jgi:hypothetical protein